MAVSPDRPLRVALLGLGTVGREVARALVGRGPELARGAGGGEIRLVAVGVRDPGRERGVALPGDVARTDDLAGLVARGGYDVLVELLGGLEPAGELVAAALRAGRSVVTANKALLARRGAELEALARESGAALRFEASVGGGIPVLSPIATDLAANRLRIVRGIVNGTTNYILTRMESEGRDYADALAEAQEKGYAEKSDPSSDVEGWDAAYKVVILARLAFGAWIDPDAVVRVPSSPPGAGRPGITGVGAADIARAMVHHRRIRLVAGAALRDDGTIEASVLPTTLPETAPLAAVTGVRNLVEVVGEPVGSVVFAGPGAGGPETSSAVLADLLAIARGEGSTWAGLPPAGRG